VRGEADRIERSHQSCRGIEYTHFEADCQRRGEAEAQRMPENFSIGTEFDESPGISPPHGFPLRGRSSARKSKPSYQQVDEILRDQGNGYRLNVVIRLEIAVFIKCPPCGGSVVPLGRYAKWLLLVSGFLKRALCPSSTTCWDRLAKTLCCAAIPRDREWPDEIGDQCKKAKNPQKGMNSKRRSGSRSYPRPGS
jgi:hypothetical protein